ncbi:MAG: CcmD family protein [Anaerolineaceae bacterium]|nr:CcmD family protein [Anaerolineaceae bacterium]
MLFSLLQTDPTPDTTGYMIAGYAVIFGVMLIYLVSLIVRARNLEQEMDALEEIDRKNASAQSIPSVGASQHRNA